MEILFKPVKELVIMECVRYPSKEALANSLAFLLRTGQPIALDWAEGVVFFGMPLPPTTDALVKDYMEGRIYWPSVMFALMPTYQAAISIGTLDVPVIDMSPNPTMRTVAGWLKGFTTSQMK